MSWRIIEGDARERLRELAAGSAQTCVTSPPYFGLRDYGHEGQIGLEPTPNGYVAALVETFREVRRVLRDDGTLWLNLGDSYYSPTATQGRNESRSAISTLSGHGADGRSPTLDLQQSTTYRRDISGLKPKDLIGIPWLVAFALRADGWYLRSDIIWAKPNPMPESVMDRPTKSHEYLFLLSKGPRYFYDADAIREPHVAPGRSVGANAMGGWLTPRNRPGRDMTAEGFHPLGRNKRTVWTVATQPYSAAHFATFPPKLIEPCVLAGSRPDDVVLDPFAGAGTTGLVALRHDRSFIGIELSSEYAALARQRIRDDGPLFNVESELAA